MTRIIIVGYMGSGKTTVGKALSKDMGIPFYDLDWYIESRMRKTVAQILPNAAKKASARLNTICSTKWLSLRMSSSAAVAEHLVSSTTWTI